LVSALPVVARKARVLMRADGRQLACAAPQRKKPAQGGLLVDA
jgi:hypothetical protein